MAGNIALQSPYGEYGSGTQRPAYLAYGTSSRRFFCYYAKLLLLISFGRVKDKLRLGGKVNWDLAGIHKTQIVDIQRFRFMLLKAPSDEQSPENRTAK